MVNQFHPSADSSNGQSTHTENLDSNTRIWTELKLANLTYIMIWASVEDLIQGPWLLRTTLYYLMTMAPRARNQSRLITAPPGRRHRARFGGHLPHRPRRLLVAATELDLTTVESSSLSAHAASANSTSRRRRHALPLPCSPFHRGPSERKERSEWEKMRSFGGLLAKNPVAAEGHVCLTCLPCVHGHRLSCLGPT